MTKKTAEIGGVSMICDGVLMISDVSTFVSSMTCGGSLTLLNGDGTLIFSSIQLVLILTDSSNDGRALFLHLGSNSL